MSLSESDAHLARTLALSTHIRAQLERYGPVPSDLMPLAESYVGFLRYAPVERSELPPALWAFAVAHRETREAYNEWEDAQSDLALHAAVSLERTKVFFSDRYRESIHACADHLPWRDPSIFPYKASAIVDDAPWIYQAAPWILAFGFLGSVDIGVVSGSLWTAVAVFASIALVTLSTLIWIGCRTGCRGDTIPIDSTTVWAGLERAYAALSFAKRKKSTRLGVALMSVSTLLSSW